ncbi:ammonia monooxygenase [Salmonella enterica]|nr:ammonia monooxygenase [Salmonella enterica]ECF8133666.1 ammonia monooxygenase [Salmonella enterica]EGI1954761.1 ammonia monooxygenase [Salmonella enterica]EMA3597694.1 ammonia monooxygenase [Salmonella enterica]
MNTQNVNVKTATKESSERWGSDPEARLACVIAEQKSFLLELCQVWNLQLSEGDEAEEVCNILCAMSKNVWNEGVMDWHTDKPLLSFHIAQPWLQAKAQAVRLYGETGRAAWAYADKSLKDCMAFECAMLCE